MALVFIDSAAHYSTLAQAQTKWDAVALLTSRSATGGRFNGPYVDTISFEKAVTAAATYVAGCSYKPSGTPMVPLITFLLNGTRQCTVVWNAASAANKISVSTGDPFGAFLGSSTTTYSTGNWIRVEVKVTIGTTTSNGSIEVRVDGAAVLTLSSVNTRGASANNLNAIRFGNATNGFNGNGAWHDFTINDTTGSDNADFLGDVRLYALTPDGAGTYSQSGSAVGASTRHEAVDETTPDDDTTYNPHTAAGQRNTFTFTDLPTGVTVLGLQHVSRVRKDDAGPITVKQLLRSNTTDSEGSELPLGTDYDYIARIVERNPDGNVAWTRTTVNALEAGVKRET